MSPRRMFNEFLLMTLGTTAISLGVYLFKFPNHFTTGGVSGLSILLGELFHNPWLTPSTFNSILTLFYLILGFFLLDKGFGLRTLYCSLLYSGLVQVLSIVMPLDAPLTDQPMLELFFSVILPALGSAILFNLDASTDIVAMILKKYTGMDVGQGLLITDVFIAGSAIFIFGIEAGLYSLLGLMLKSIIVDGATESLNRRKAFMVITSQPQVVTEYINGTLGRGATIWEGTGAYTGETHQVVLAVLSRSQAVLLRRHLRVADPTAFFIITNSSEIVGKGFYRA